MGDTRSSSDRPPSEEFQYVSVPASAPQSLSRAVYARRAEYTRPHDIKVKIGTWNVAACPDVEKDISSWFIEGKGLDKDLIGLDKSNRIEDYSQGHVESIEAQESRMARGRSALPLGDHETAVRDKIGLYVLGLQEFVELTSAKEYLTRVYVDLGPANKWKSVVAAALPDGYRLIAEPQLSGLLLLIYASPEIASTISSVSSASIGTGFLGYLGNKGAVVTRVVLGDTTRLVFVNCHLASGTEAGTLDRRCWDVAQILARTQFEPISRSGVIDDAREGIGDEDFAFWFGDLNFRLDGLPGDDIRRILMLHTNGEYGRGSKPREQLEELLENDSPILIHHIDSDDDESEPFTPHARTSAFQGRTSSSLPDPDEFIEGQCSDPASLQATLESLLPHDQLRQVQKLRKAFHEGWREGPITFLPTYKYDVGSVGMFDSSEKKRAPSWCDRILFRTRRDKLEYEEKLREEALAKLKDEEMKARGLDKAAEDDNVLYDYDPETDGDEADGEMVNGENEDPKDGSEVVITKEGYVDKLRLDSYTSYQRVLSSDHKPVAALFTLQYDAVVPELKSKIHHEVARDLDRAENEGRPVITVVIDNLQEADDGSTNIASTPVGGPEIIDFGEVRYLQRKSRGLTIANTGRVPAQLAFVKISADTSGVELIAPEWLSVNFASSDDEKTTSVESEMTLEPGDAVNVMLQVYVENIAHVKALNKEEMQLDDILVLRVADGREHFLPLRGTWMQSCFGRSIDELIRIPEGGVRALRPQHNGNGGPVNRDMPVCWSAPRELFKLTETVELLTIRAVADRDMVDNTNFPINSIGWPFDERTWIYTNVKDREIRRGYLLEALDADKNIIDCFPPEVSAAEKLEITSEILVNFLGSLDDGLIPSTLWWTLEQRMTTRKQSIDPEEERNWVLDVLSTSPNHNISLVFLTSMLVKIAAELAPTPQMRSTTSAGSNARGPSHRRSLSLKGKKASASQDPATVRRRALGRRWAEIFAGVIFRTPTTSREKERKLVEDRRREIVEAFLQDGLETGGV
jgi:inositol polyphosphate 5-phosphatase INPP5B/F